VERSTYLLISSLLLALVCWRWQAISAVVWNVSSPTLKAISLALCAPGWLIDSCRPDQPGRCRLPSSSSRFHT